ncbi:hypothetical protein V6R21_10125 [Limibacter armeniacum]|uniref:hypothetical protein n=1 Tax=Limibacter armeniacum TaxID=466084 RepID=UPI002FE62E06
MGYYGIKTKEDFYGASFGMSDISLNNSYFDELDKLKTRRKNEVLQKAREQKIAEQNDYLAEQKRKAQEKLKELEIEAERERKAKEREELNAKVASGYKATTQGYQQFGYQNAQQYINQMEANYNALQKSIDNSISTYFEKHVKQENNAFEKVAKAEAGYEKVNRERKRRGRQVGPIRSLLSVLEDYSFNYSNIKHLDSGNIYIQLIHLSTKSGSTVHDYTTAPQKSYIPSVDDFITDVLPVYYVYSSDVITVPIHNVNAHEFLFNNYIDDILDKSRYMKNGYGVFTRVFFREDHLNNYMNTLHRNYHPTPVLDFFQDDSKFQYASFDDYVNANIEKEKKWNLYLAQKEAEKNGNTKKTYKNGDVYEGDFVSSARHGWGKMIYKSGHVYEGKWIDNLEGGYGKMIYPNGAIYEGDWFAGSRNGFGKTTYTSGDIYEGEWKNGKKEGTGKYLWAEGHVYMGDWKDDKREGLGEFIKSNGYTYSGEWMDGVYHGNGKLKYPDGDTYEGEWKNGEKNGFGKSNYFFNSNKGVYEGEYKDGFRNGTGKNILPNGDVYEGEYKDDKREGQGKFVMSDGRVYDGVWVKGKKVGIGTFTWPNGQVYSGEFKEDQINGQGTYSWPTGQVYSGEWSDGEYHGKGKLTMSGGAVYEGEFIEGDIHGQGTHSWPSGHVYVGEFIEGKRNGQGEMFYPGGDTYIGEWKDDIKDGQGQLKHTDGSQYSGGWKNDEKHGKGYVIENNEAAEVEWENGELVSRKVIYISAKFNGAHEFYMWLMMKANETIPKPFEGEARFDLWFTVDENGKVKVDDYKAIYMNFTEEEIKFNYEKEMKKIVKSSGVWIPATMQGEAIAQKQFLSISILPADIFINYRPIIN